MHQIEKLRAIVAHTQSEKKKLEAENNELLRMVRDNQDAMQVWIVRELMLAAD